MNRHALLCLLTTSPLAERIGPSPTGERLQVFFPSGDLAGVVNVPPEDHVSGEPAQVEAQRATDAGPVRCRVLSHDRTPLGEVDVTEMQAAAAYTDTTGRPCRTGHVGLYAARASGQMDVQAFPLTFR